MAKVLGFGENAEIGLLKEELLQKDNELLQMYQLNQQLVERLNQTLDAYKELAEKVSKENGETSVTEITLGI
jgi:uncharacterized protein YoxC